MHVFGTEGMFAAMCIRDSSDKDVTALTFAIVNSYIDWTARTVNTRLHFCVRRDVFYILVLS